jgi:hypothetical protein
VAMLAASVVPDYRNRFPNADSADP